MHKLTEYRYMQRFKHMVEKYADYQNDNAFDGQSICACCPMAKDFLVYNDRYPTIRFIKEANDEHGNCTACFMCMSIAHNYSSVDTLYHEYSLNRAKDREHVCCPCYKFRDCNRIPLYEAKIIIRNWQKANRKINPMR